MQFTVGTVKKLLLTKAQAESIFGRHIADQCLPFGFERKLNWVFVEDLLEVLSREMPNALISQELVEIFLCDLAPSVWEGGDHPACRSNVLYERFKKARETLLSTPSLDIIGATKVERLFSLSRAYVHSASMKMRSLDPKLRPARWSVCELVQDLRLASAEIARRRLPQVKNRQKALDTQRTILTKLSTLRGILWVNTLIPKPSRWLHLCLQGIGGRLCLTPKLISDFRLGNGREFLGIEAF